MNTHGFQHVLTAALACGAMTFGVSGQHRIGQSYGTHADAWYGSALAPLGDADGDGVADWIVGMPRSSYGTAVDRGLVVAISGRTGSWIAAVTGRAGSRLGSAVAGVGDVDGDGVPDFAAGGPRDDRNGSNAGFVTVRSGVDGRELWSLSGAAGSRLGTSLAGIGDLDGDGLPEIAIGAPNAARDQVAIHAGVSGRRVQALIGSVGLGASLAAGDLDGDGSRDLVVGEPTYAQNGRAIGRVWAFGIRPGEVRQWWSRVGSSPRPGLGASLAIVDDIDGDGREEVLAGAVSLVGFLPSVSLLSGATGSELRTHHGRSTVEFFGHAVAGIGDVDGDGQGDYAVGAPGDLVGGIDSGRMDVFDGRTGNLLFERRGRSGDKCGYAVAGVGDLDGDGLADIALGSPLADDRHFNGGKVELLGYDLAGYARSFGSACAGTHGLPDLDAEGSLRRGGELRFRLQNTPPFVPGLLLLGVSSTSWGALSLPLPLDGQGMPGCSLLVSGELLFPFVAPNAATSIWQAQLPGDATIVNRRIFAQAFVVDAGNAAGLVTTNGLEVRFGN